MYIKCKEHYTGLAHSALFLIKLLSETIQKANYKMYQTTMKNLPQTFFNLF